MRFGIGQPGRLIVIRLEPGEDVLPGLADVLERAHVDNALVVSAVASLKHATLRNITRFPTEWPITADCRVTTRLDEPLEIVSMQGNAARSTSGSMMLHLHACLSRGMPPGETFSGHLLEDSIVATTCEVAVVEATGLELRRARDPLTLADELSVE